MKGTGEEEEGGGRYRAALTSALPQHPIAVGVDVPGASRSLTEPHGASRSLSSAAAGLQPDRRGGGLGQPHALCLHALTAQRRDPGGRARRGDGPDGQTERSGPLSMLLSVPPPVTVPSGD